MEDNRDMKELCKEAVFVQGACNLSGVIHSWSKSISRLRLLMENASTSVINNHPINLVFADKVASLTGTQQLSSPNSNLANAYEWVSKMAGEF